MINRSKGEKAFQVFNYIFLTLLGLAFLIPYLLIVVASFTPESVFLAKGFTLFPGKFSVEAYAEILVPESGIINAFISSLIITIGGVVGQVTITTLTAYPLSKTNLVGGRACMGLIIFSMLFSGGLIPSYLWLAGTLKLKNNYLAVILPALLSPWNLILIRNYFLSLPSSVEEAAKMDGCNDFRIFLQIVVPVSVPIIATVTLFAAVDFWNAWSAPVLYFDSNHHDMLPLTALLREMVQQDMDPSGGTRGVSEAVKMATTVITTLPIICVYPFIQRYFMSGIMLGSIKG